MKKLLFILAAVVLAVACTDKPEFETPGAGTPQSMELVYDTAQITSDPESQFEQTLNFNSDFYRVGGKYVKLTVYLAGDGVHYLTTTAFTEDDIEDANAGALLECEIAKVDGDFSTPSQVNVRSVEDGDYYYQADLPEATELQEPTEEQPENVSMYKAADDARPAYVVRYKDDNDKVVFGFVFTVNSVEMLKTVVEESVPSGNPFDAPTVKEVPYYTTTVGLLYKAFDGNYNWVN